MGKDQRAKNHGLDIRKNRKLKAAKQGQFAPPPQPQRRGKGKR